MNGPTAPSQAWLQAEGLRLQVGTRVLVDGLDLAVAPGEVWALLGPNGAGKTTLLHTLAGLRAPAAGQVRLAGRPLDAWPPLEAARLRGLLPQVLGDAFSASVREVVLLGRHPHLARWSWEGPEDEQLAHAALSAVDLDGFGDRDVLTLSGGERQRVGLAALLAQDPRLLLLDEPLAHLDLHHQMQVGALLRSRAAVDGRAVMLAVHDLNLAHRFASHALVLGPFGYRAGPVDAVMTEAVLGEAFGHRLQRAAVAGRTVFVPA